jgi:hypothetical protein
MIIATKKMEKYNNNNKNNKIMDQPDILCVCEIGACCMIGMINGCFNWVVVNVHRRSS